MAKEVWDDDIGVIEGECEGCGDYTKIKPCVDPYASEINNEYVDMGCVCRQCFVNRAEQI